MKKITEGIYVEEMEDYRSYIIEADYSEHIDYFKSNENATQEIGLREDAPAEEIYDYVKDHEFQADLNEDNEIIFVQTEDPTKLVLELAGAHYINYEQATAIMAHEIEHIKNPKMKEKLKGQKSIKEVREVVIQYKMSQKQTGQDVHNVGSGAPKGKGQAK